MRSELARQNFCAIFVRPLDLIGSIGGSPLRVIAAQLCQSPSYTPLGITRALDVVRPPLEQRLSFDT
jgi:hypothetical protein